MFERTLYSVIDDGIATLVANPDRIRTVLEDIPDWEDGAIDTVIAQFTDETDNKPRVRMQYPRSAADLPCFSITLGMEKASQYYLGDGEVPSTTAAFIYQMAEERIAEIEKRFGAPVNFSLQRERVSYPVIVYTEHPDITLAYYRILKVILLEARKRMLDECFEEMELEGSDLTPDPRYLSDHVYTRQLVVSGYYHYLWAEDAGLGPVGVGRGTRITRIHVNDSVTGVNPGVDPYDPSED